MEERLGASSSQSNEFQRVSKRHSIFPRLSNPTKKPQICMGAGLGNLGNTCFLNVILQCITHTVPIIQRLRSTFHPLPCFGEGEGFCTFCAFKEHIEDSFKSSGSVIWPEKFRDYLTKFSCDFVAGEQADAHEYLRCFLDNLNTSSVIKNKSSCFDENGIVKEVFGGRLKSQLRCGECGHISDTYEPFLDLSLEIHDSVQTLENALHSFTKIETLDDPDVRFTCQGCETRVSNVQKQMKLDQAPDVLAFQLKRFKNDGVQIEKIDKYVEYPVELDLRPFVSCSNRREDMQYELYALVEHKGTFDYGHYVSTVRSSPSSWHFCNDSQVMPITETSALNQTAYILFYVKKGISPCFSTLMAGFPSETLTLNGESSEGSPVSVLRQSSSSSEDDEVSPKSGAANPAPAARFNKTDACGAVGNEMPIRENWVANLHGLFDDEELTEDEQDVYFVPAQSKNFRRFNKGNEKPVQKFSPVKLVQKSFPARYEKSSPARPVQKPSPVRSVQRSAPAQPVRVFTNPKKNEYDLNSSLRGMNSKRRTQLLDCLQSDSSVESTKKGRKF